jgi:hypothetical protein
VNSSLNKRKSRANLMDDQIVSPPPLSPSQGLTSNSSNLTPPNNSKNSIAPSASTKDPDLHVPYLNSKLTHALKDIFGGNCKTALLLHLGPEADNYHPNVIAVQNLSKALKIVNNPRINRIAIPEEFLIDEFSDASLIAQLRQYYVEPLLKANKSFRRPSKLTSCHVNLLLLIAFFLVQFTVCTFACAFSFTFCFCSLSFSFFLFLCFFFHRWIFDIRSSW